MKRIKKSAFLVSVVCLAVSAVAFVNFSVPASKAQEGKQLKKAPPSLEFQRYLDLKKRGELQKTTSKNHSLGLIPSPLRSDNAPVKDKDSLESSQVNREGFPASYDLRSLGRVSSVKDQGNCGSCWAFATMGSLESHWLTLGGSESNLSENNLKECHNFEWSPCDGGNMEIATSYLSQNDGPISEANDPYVAVDDSCHSGFSPVAYVPDARFLPNDSDLIKQYLTDYGALYTSLYMSEDPAYYNSSNSTYYYNGIEVTNHAVTLAGWDDSKVTAGGIGAWIVKNSWGTAWGDSGYFYVSYNDTKINSSVSVWTSKIDYTSSKTIYMYDEIGIIGDVGYSDETDYGLTKFVASGNQQITKVGTWRTNNYEAPIYGASFSFEIYDDFNGTTLSNSLGSLSSQAADYYGYYTFDLPSPISISSGNDFYIKATYNTPGYNYPIPIEAADSEYANPTIETGKNWVSNTGSGWTALGGGTANPYDLNIRAYALSAELAATPTASPTGGAYTSAQSVTLSTSTSGATIHYTTNGSTPTASSASYASPISISSTITLKAIAVKAGANDSSVMSATYNIQVATPSATPAGGSYNSSQSVTLSTATGGATIRYTTDGSTPTSSSAAYSSALSISTDTTVKAIAVKSGMNDSAVMSESYSIQVNTDISTLAHSTSKKAKKRINLTFRDLTLTKKKWVKVRINGRKVAVQRVKRIGNDSIVRIYLRYKKWAAGNYSLVMSYKNQTRVSYTTKKGKIKYRKGWDSGTVTSENILSII
ncbi:MAG: C1 family peptidase [Candidatus Moranbacteria bacterium]|nr:C1 family peptidase [Candidatus Moranbacteria bacterium]